MATILHMQPKTLSSYPHSNKESAFLKDQVWRIIGQIINSDHKITIAGR
jgi:hypothetical protein